MSQDYSNKTSFVEFEVVSDDAKENRNSMQKMKK